MGGFRLQAEGGTTRSASLTSSIPLFSYRFASVIREGEELHDGETGRLAWAASIDDQYFMTMDIPRSVFTDLCLTR